MKKSDALSLLFGMMAAGLEIKDDHETNQIPTSTGKKHKVIPRGCKEYEIDGMKIIAISEKSAIKKHNKRKSKQP